MRDGETNMLKKLCFACGVLALAGCGTSAVISDINDSAVHVQVHGDIQDPKVRSEAQQGCQRYDKSAQYVSHRCLDGYCIAKDVLFTCS
jgi:hypothetical protein